VAFRRLMGTSDIASIKLGDIVSSPKGSAEVWPPNVFHVLLPDAARNAYAGISVYSGGGAIMRFLPAWATRCTDGVNFGVEGRLLHAKFDPIGAGVGRGAPKLKILSNFGI